MGGRTQAQVDSTYYGASMSQETEQLIALAPWAAFIVAVLIFALIDVRDRVREHRQPAPRRIHAQAVTRSSR
jgi:hypothetical protein